MTAPADSRPIALGNHPGLGRLLQALPMQRVPVTPRDYARIEQVFPPDHELPWAEARELLADLLAADPEQHARVSAAFAEFIPLPRERTPRLAPAPDPSTGGTVPTTITTPKNGDTAPDRDTPDAIVPPAPPTRWIAWITALLLLLVVAAGVWLQRSPTHTEQGTPRPETTNTSEAGELPSDPVPRFHAWVPVIEPRGLTAEPLWPAGLLLITGILAVGWLWQRLRDLKQPIARLPKPRLQPGGPRQAGWTPEQWRLPRTLSPAQRRVITWGVQRFDAEQTRDRLDSAATVSASARAGIPSLRYAHRRRERQVWLWRDTRLRSRRTIALADELSALLDRAGLPVRCAGYSGIPDRLWFDGNTPVSAFDLAAPARDALVVIFGDIQALRQTAADTSADGRRVQRLLRELDHWPRVCLLDSNPQGSDKALGLQRLQPAALPAWLAERPLPADNGSNNGDERITATEARHWATACALPGRPITEQQTAALYHRLGLPPAWELPPPPLARGSAGQWGFSAADRRRLLQQLADRLWQGRAQAGQADKSSADERRLSTALAYWKDAIEGIDGAAVGTPTNRSWPDSRGQHQARIDISLLELWNADGGRRAQAVADLFARHRSYAAAIDGPQPVEPRALLKRLRGRLGELSAQGLGSDSAGRIRLPWHIDQAGERPGDPPGTTRARLLAMGFAGAEDSGRPRPSTTALLALGAGLGLAATGLVLLLLGVMQAPTPIVTQVARGTAIDPGTAIGKRFADEARVELDGRRLRAIGPKLLTERVLPINHGADVHWCWSGVANDDPDTPCSRLTDDDYRTQVVNQLLTDADDDTVLLRAGSLAEPIRACADAWPALSVAVIDAPAWRYPPKPGATEPAEAIAARRLAIRLLDSGAVDLAIVGPHWRKEAEQLAEFRAEPDSQWLFFSPPRASPDQTTAATLPSAFASHQASIRADYEALAGQLRDQVDGAPALDDTATALPAAITAVSGVHGRPRLWGGPEVFTADLGGGVGMDFVQVCPGTYTIGSTSLVKRRLTTVIAESLGRSENQLTDAGAIDVKTLGSDARARLRAALQHRLGTTLGDDEWKGITHIADARAAFSQRLERSSEGPAHPLLMDRFAIARTETTRAQLRALRPGLLQSSSVAGDRRPAAENTWNEAVAACNKAGGRLPTEAQWEYAARGGSRGAWPWGDDATATAEHAWFAGDSDFPAKPVALKPANPLGLRDMHGNHWEWARDCWDADAYRMRADGLRQSPEVDAAGCRSRVLRGGSFLSEPRRLRSALRRWASPEDWGGSIGFRCVRSGARGLDSSSP